MRKNASLFDCYLNTEAVCQLSANYFALEVLIWHIDDVNLLLTKPVTSEDLSQCLSSKAVCHLL